VENIFTRLLQKFYDIMGDVGGTIGDGGRGGRTEEFQKRKPLWPIPAEIKGRFPLLFPAGGNRPSISDATKQGGFHFRNSSASFSTVIRLQLFLHVSHYTVEFL